jgi:signal peptidase I
MEPTIFKQDRLLIDLKAYKKGVPKRGDVILYRYPLQKDKIYFHRIAGLPNESIEIKDHKIYINGIKLADSWAVKIRHYNGGKLSAKGARKEVIPQDSYYVLGDNSARSQDSRYWGALQKEYIIGKAVKIYYPFNRSSPVE